MTALAAVVFAAYEPAEYPQRALLGGHALNPRSGGGVVHEHECSFMHIRCRSRVHTLLAFVPRFLRLSRRAGGWMFGTIAGKLGSHRGDLPLTHAVGAGRQGDSGAGGSTAGPAMMSMSSGISRSSRSARRWSLSSRGGGEAVGQQTVASPLREPCDEQLNRYFQAEAQHRACGVVHEVPVCRVRGRPDQFLQRSELREADVVVAVSVRPDAQPGRVRSAFLSGLISRSKVL